MSVMFLCFAVSLIVCLTPDLTLEMHFLSFFRKKGSTSASNTDTDVIWECIVVVHLQYRPTFGALLIVQSKESRNI